MNRTTRREAPSTRGWVRFALSIVFLGVTSAAAGCGGDGEGGFGPEERGLPGLAATLTSGTGVWLQPDWLPPELTLFGSVRTHAIWTFRRDFAGRRLSIIQQPNGFIPSQGQGAFSFGWRVRGDVVALQFTFPGNTRSEEIIVRQRSPGVLDVVTNAPAFGSNGQGVWFACQTASCQDLFFQLSVRGAG